MERVGQNHSTVGENVVWEADVLLHTQPITLLICAHIVSSLVIMGRLDEEKLTSQAKTKYSAQSTASTAPFRTILKETVNKRHNMFIV